MTIVNCKLMTPQPQTWRQHVALGVSPRRKPRSGTCQKFRHHSRPAFQAGTAKVDVTTINAGVSLALSSNHNPRHRLGKPSDNARTLIFQFTIVNLTFSISSTEFTRPAKQGGAKNEPRGVFRGGLRRCGNRRGIESSDRLAAWTTISAQHPPLRGLFYNECHCLASCFSGLPASPAPEPDR